MKNTQVRRITAERLLQSKTTIPHYYLTVDLNADKLLELRAQLNEKLAASGGKLSVNDFIVKASALVRLHYQPADLEMSPRASWQTSARKKKTHEEPVPYLQAAVHTLQECCCCKFWPVLASGLFLFQFSAGEEKQVSKLWHIR